MRTLKLYFYGLLVFLFAIFILQNYSTLTYSVALRFNLGFLSLVSIPLPLFLIAPLFFFCGLFLATIIGWGERSRLSKELKQLKGTRPESKPDTPPEPKPEVKQESKPEPWQELRPDPPQVPWPEPIPETEPKKKPEEGTIVSSVSLIKRADFPGENNPPQLS